MVAAALTTDDLVTAVKDQACVAPAEGRFGTATYDLEKGILRCADRVMRGAVSDLLTSTRAQHWGRAYSDVTVVSGTTLYGIPARSLGAGLVDVKITDGTNEWSAPEITVENAWRYISDHGGWDSPYAYCWRDNFIELLPHPTAGAYFVRFLYARQPSLLVPTAFCGDVSAVGSNTLTASLVSAVASGGWVSPTVIDVVSSLSNGTALEDDVAITFSGSTITRSSGTWTTTGPYAVTVDSFACLAGKTCVPQVPQTLWPVLVDGTALEVVRAFGDMAGVLNAREQLQESVTRARSVLSPRSRGASQKIVAHGYGTRRGWR